MRCRSARRIRSAARGVSNISRGRFAGLPGKGSPRSIVEGILLDTMFDLSSLEGVEKVVISKQVVEGTTRPFYIYVDRAADGGATDVSA